MPLSEIGRPGFYQLAFAPQPDSRGRDYYALIELVGAGRIKLDRAAGDAYLDGALYQDGQATDAQITGTLIYNTPQMLLRVCPAPAGLAGAAAGWHLPVRYPRLGVAGAVAWCGPLLLGRKARPGRRPQPGALPRAAALDQPGGPTPGGALCLATAAGRPCRSAMEQSRLAAAHASGHLAHLEALCRLWPDLLLVIVLVLLVAGRFQVADSLDVPLWGDSYHHTMIAQLLVDNGGLFDSWQPYAEMQTFTYHFGFHTAVAALHWFSGLALPQAVVWAGQLLNVLAVLALYPLAVRLGGSRWAGVAAVLLAGLIAPMPSYYVNWGRYTQLAGQAILPAAIYLSWVAVADQRPAGTNAAGTMRRRIGWPFLILPWVALAGVGLTHYRI